MGSFGKGILITLISSTPLVLSFPLRQEKRQVHVFIGGFNVSCKPDWVAPDHLTSSMEGKKAAKLSEQGLSQGGLGGLAVMGNHVLDRHTVICFDYLRKCRIQKLERLPVGKRTKNIEGRTVEWACARFVPTPCRFTKATRLKIADDELETFGLIEIILAIFQGLTDMVEEECVK